LSSNAHKRAWEDWGAVNPLYGILTDPRFRHGGDVDEFLRSGEGTVTPVLDEVERLSLCRQRRTALDFGCGIGRLTAPLAQRFDQVTGVDVSTTMLATARRLHGHVPNCSFVANDRDDLQLFEDASFDLVLCLFVLQHLDSTTAIERYVAELVRVLRPGGAAVLQLSSVVLANRPPLPPLRSRAGVKARSAIALRRLGVPPGILYRTLDWVPEMTMLAMPDEQARSVLEGAGGHIVHVAGPESDAGGTVHRTYYVTRSL